MSIKTYKYRLYPTKQQCKELEQTLALCCELYNAALQERRDAWKMCGKSISFYDQDKQLPEIKEIRPEYKQIGAHVLRNVLKRVDLAFQAFYRRVKRGKTPGYPRFQGRGRYDSFCFPDRQNWNLQDNRLTINHLGTIKIKMHRTIEGTIKTATIKRESDQWFVTFCCEIEPATRMPYTDYEIGIDLGLLHFATLSTGDTIENPRYYRKGEKKLEQSQQSLSRKKRGSKRCKKVVARVAKCHRKVRNQRNDFLHKQSRQLVDTYGLIVFEDLAPSNLIRRPKPKQDEATGEYLPNGASAKAGLNKSILDAGWSRFVTLCQYKAESAGTVQVIKVSPKFTSQTCSQCGTVKKKELSERWHSCECGCSLDRDVNAAKNILALGRSVQQTRC